MGDYIQQQKDELDDYVSKWEKAQKDGVFDSSKTPKLIHKLQIVVFLVLFNLILLKVLV